MSAGTPAAADRNRFGFGLLEERNARLLIELALAEDLDALGDLTSMATIPAEGRGVAVFVARAPGVLCGTPILDRLADRFGLEPWPDGARVDYPSGHADGAILRPGDRVARVRGPMRALLTLERTALNFLQRLSGVASQTARYVAAAAGHRAVVLDTRKTTPGWRALEKYAVRAGGGANHRIGLYDGVLIKDNHLAWLEAGGDPIGRAVAAGRALAPAGTPVEVEVDGLAQLDRALACRPDIVLIDNFPTADMVEAVRRRDAAAPGVLLEASGGVNLETIAAIARTGVDRISVGALTHSAPALDLALDFEAVIPGG